jgi:uncharacterized protein involved in outer membrane biogenesis
MRRIWKIAGISGALLGLAVAGAAAFLSTLDVNRYRDLIGQQVKAATGRELTISGDLNLEISLNPALAVENVTFANAPWGTRPHMVTLKRLAAEVELLPLFRGEIRINRLILAGLGVLAETNPQGTGNWEFAAGNRPGDEGLVLSAIRELRAEDMRVTVRDGITGASKVIVVHSLTAAAQSMDAPLRVDVRARYDDVPFEVGGRVGSLQALLAGNVPVEIDAEGSALGSVVEARGTVVGSRPPTGADLSITAEGEDLARVARALAPLEPSLKGISKPLAGPFRFAATLRASKDRIALSAVDLSAGRTGILALKVSGAVADVNRAGGLDLAVSASGEDLTRAVKTVPWLKGVVAPPVGPFDLSARVRGSLKRLSLNGIKADVGHSDALHLSAAGNVADVTKGSGLDLSVSLTGVYLKESLKTAKAGKPFGDVVGRYDKFVPPWAGPFSVSARVGGTAVHPSLSEINAEAGRGKAIHLVASGAVADLTGLADLNVAVSFGGDDLTAAVAQLGGFKPAVGLVPDLARIKLPPLGAYAVHGRLSGPARKPSLGGLRIDVGSQKMIRLAAAGSVADIFSGDGVDLALSAKGDDLAKVVTAVRNSALAGGLEPYFKTYAPALRGPFTVAGRVGRSGGAFSLGEMRFDAGDRRLGRLRASGAIADLAKVRGLDVSLTLRGDEFKHFFTLAGEAVPALKEINLPIIGPYSVGTRVRGSQKKVSLGNIRLSMGRANRLLLKASGSVGDLLKGSGVDVKFDAVGDNISPFSQTLGVKIKSPGAFRVRGRLVAGQGAAAVRDFYGALGGTNLSGQVAVAMGADRYRVEAGLKSTMVNLDAILGNGAAKDQKPSKAQESAPDDGRVFSAEPIPFDLLHLIDADVTLSIARLIVDGLPFNDVKGRMDLRSGRLLLKPFSADLAGGTVSGQLFVDGRKATRGMNVTADAARVDYGFLLEHFGIIGVARGKVDATVDLRGQGGSMGAILAGANGRVRVTTEGGRLESGLLNVLSADIISALPFIRRPDDRNVRCGVLDFGVTGGKAAARTLLFETKGVSLVGKGWINLAREELGLVIDPRAKNISVLQLARVPVRISGTLKSPIFVPDPAAMAVGAVKGVADLGASALGAIMGIASGQRNKVDRTDYCALALGDAQPVVAPRPARKNTAVKDAVNDVGNALGGVVRGIGNLLGGGKRKKP